MYKAFFKAKDETDRNFDISYCISEKDGTFFIEAFIDGSSVSERAFLGNCGERKAEELALLFAKRAVRPIHIEDIISDMRF